MTRRYFTWTRRIAADGYPSLVETDVTGEVHALAEALKGVSNAYGCFAGCTGGLPGAPPDRHSVACKAARAALVAVEPPEEQAYKPDPHGFDLPDAPLPEAQP